MGLKTVYIVLCVAGLVLPYSQFIPSLVEHRLNINLLLQEMFVSRIPAFLAFDVLISAAALVVFIYGENSRIARGGKWLSLVALVTLGVALALPLFP